MELTRQPRVRCARFPENICLRPATCLVGVWQTPVVDLVTPENRLMGREANPKTPRKHYMRARTQQRTLAKVGVRA
eukprot:3726040-Pyramimonas_sp.AAC.1